jgi:hypothetical protein
MGHRERRGLRGAKRPVRSLYGFNKPEGPAASLEYLLLDGPIPPVVGAVCENQRQEGERGEQDPPPRSASETEHRHSLVGGLCLRISIEVGIEIGGH